MNVDIQPFSIKYNANNGGQYVARSLPQRYVYTPNGTFAQPCDIVNVSQVDNQGKILSTSDMTHGQFFSYLLQQGINVPYHQYEMPKNN
ncbi:hypothetical protein IJ182_09990 [bacterium]|nr:hypothetical protein [bacterium]